MSEPVMEWTGRRFEVWYAYDIRVRLKEAGWRYDPALKVWWTDEPRKAVKCIKLADKPTKALLLDKFA